jgi:hypothetical protein
VQSAIHIFLSFAFLFAGLNPVRGFSALYDLSTIEISHSHSHDHVGHDHHHHDDEAEDQDIADPSDHDEEDEENQSHDQHTHEIIVSCIHTLLVEVKSPVLVSFNLDNSYPLVKNILPQPNRSLGSIFRPPIFA